VLEADFATGVFVDPAGRPRFLDVDVFTLCLTFELAAFVLLTAASATSSAESFTLSAAFFVFSTADFPAALAFSLADLLSSFARLAAASAALRASAMGSILAVSDYEFFFH